MIKGPGQPKKSDVPGGARGDGEEQFHRRNQSLFRVKAESKLKYPKSHCDYYISNVRGCQKQSIFYVPVYQSPIEHTKLRNRNPNLNFNPTF